jgi:protease-4
MTPDNEQPARTPSERGGWDETATQIAQLYLQERRSDRRWRVFFRLVWLAVFALLAWAAYSDHLLPAPPIGPHTALVEVRGEIASDTEASADNLIGALRSAFED